MTALVVDDIAENRHVLAQMLESIGCRVHTAASGEEAIRQLHGTAADVVFMDIRMDGMSGLDVIHRLQADDRWAALKLVATTASALAHEQQAYHQAGFDEVIAKPIQLERVCECLKNVLGVSFEYEVFAAAVDSDGTRLQELSHLSADLRQQLNTAADMHDVTRLKQLIADMESAHIVSAGAIEELRQCVLIYDMTAIVSATTQGTASPAVLADAAHHRI